MNYPYSLPELPYKYDELEPVIDATTMEVHHTKHHQAYIDNLNGALEQVNDLQSMSLAQLLKKTDDLPNEVQGAVINHGGGHANHSLFWVSLSPKGTEMSVEFKKCITSAFGSVDSFKNEFEKAAMTRFGSGWAWLVVDASGLRIVSTPNQDSPIMQGLTPLLGLDVWEHAYYLSYQNRRAEYVSSIWNIIDWDAVEKRL